MTVRRGMTVAEHLVVIASVAIVLAIVVGVFKLYRRYALRSDGRMVAMSAAAVRRARAAIQFNPRIPVVDSSGFIFLNQGILKWRPDATLAEVADAWRGAAYRRIDEIDREQAQADLAPDKRIANCFTKAALLNSEGETDRAYQVLHELRTALEREPKLGPVALGTLIYFQGVTALRRGENDNCVMCRGESSCILPISPAAVHTIPAGSRLAIQHFTEYLNVYPDDLEVRWLLNLAHMTLGEYPDAVDSRYRLDLERYFHSEFDIGKFRDVGHLTGVNRFNQAGGAIMEDFDNDGLLDIALSSLDPTVPMAYYRNKGDGSFEDRSQAAGVTDQLGGLVCYQTDYDNDGRMDIFVARGAWIGQPVRPSLLHNEGDGRFVDVTSKAGMEVPVNSNGAAWADYNNDGWLDLFVSCERQPNRLYRSRGDGTFEEVARQAGVQGEQPSSFCKGCAWIDYDNDDYPDLFVNNLSGVGKLYHNKRDGTFADVSSETDIDGPHNGFSCWAWDYDNDGWLDIFATCYDRTLGDVVKGMLGQMHSRYSNRLFHNVAGKRFEAVTADVGLDLVFATMGSNFADFDNDGWLDFYLATGEPSLSALVPNRMFKNVGGRRFAEITSSSGTGHLQKGHAVACGDWDRDGDIDLFVQTGGAVNGDRYHDVLFQNPGQGNHSLTLKLKGTKTNRAAFGARVKVVTAGETPLTIHRHVTSGSSFGANPLEQTIGVGRANRIAVLEIHWPTSRTTQVFRDIAVDQAIEVTESADSYRTLKTKRVPQPQ
jgi:FG-GAP-like repeat/ASPIC and UnbV